ncbi:YlxR family protein [Micromonospora sonneratiae]
MVRRAWPVRTCVGCRQRAPAHELLRFIAVSDGAGHSLQPDPTRRLSGRGAHLHPDPACLALAQRRRAFGRALRITGVLDTGELVEHLNASTTTFGHPVERGSQSKAR